MTLRNTKLFLCHCNGVKISGKRLIAEFFKVTAYLCSYFVYFLYSFQKGGFIGFHKTTFGYKIYYQITTHFLIWSIIQKKKND